MVKQYIHELTSAGTAYSVEVDDSEADNPEIDGPEVVIMLIKNERKSCFHIAVPWSNIDIEHAIEVCAQQVLYRTKRNDPDVYFAVYDFRTQTLYFCLFNPSSQRIEDVFQRSMVTKQEQVARRLKDYIASNAKVLS